MSDPDQLLSFLPDADALVLRAPHALVAFGGWVDAGSGGTGAVRHLITNLKSRKLAEMDPEEFYNFTDTRPLVSIIGAGERAIHWPRGEFHGAVLEHTSDLVLFVAPEPNLKWKTFASVMLDGLQHFGVQSMVCIGSIFGAVPHRGEVRMTGWANDDRSARSARAAQRDVHQLRGADRLRDQPAGRGRGCVVCRRWRCTGLHPTTFRACPTRTCRTRCCRRFRGSRGAPAAKRSRSRRAAPCRVRWIACCRINRSCANRSNAC